MAPWTTCATKAEERQGASESGNGIDNRQDRDRSEVVVTALNDGLVQRLLQLIVLVRAHPSALALCEEQQLLFELLLLRVRLRVLYQLLLSVLGSLRSRETAAGPQKGAHRLGLEVRQTEPHAD